MNKAIKGAIAGAMVGIMLDAIESGAMPIKKGIKSKNDEYKAYMKRKGIALI